MAELVPSELPSLNRCIPERMPILEDKRVLVGQGIKDPVSSIMTRLLDTYLQTGRGEPDDQTF
ncbi:MAG: hypothetical protein R3C11_08110 [Planctomycetaceae bacterium]